MRNLNFGDDLESLSILDNKATRVLDKREERQLLREMAECRQKLASALANVPGAEPPTGADDPQALAHFIARFYTGNGPDEARLGAVFHHYAELRGRLAMANMRLVAHVAKQFRERGVSYSDLMQEGFCGLLEAIDRFDLHHETKLATYATWWIRQAMQRAVAAGAYPVRLSPRHLRQLAQNQDHAEHARIEGGFTEPDTVKSNGVGADVPSSEMIQRIHAATRPTVSLNAILDSDTNFNLLQTMSNPEGDRADDVDMDETISRLVDELRPREQQVVALRFGLGGKPRLSLSQVGKVLEVSKERVRQIQDRAITKLRTIAEEHNISESGTLGP